MGLCKLLLVGGLSLISLATQAENLKGLYQVREPVTGQSPEAVSYTHLTLPTNREV